MWCLCLCLVGGIPQAFAQEEGDEFMLEEIVVTGSRIIRRDAESNRRSLRSMPRSSDSSRA
jgi:hypothetical protein